MDRPICQNNRNDDVIHDKSGAVSPTFCIYPFKSLNIVTGGSAKPCCVYMSYVEKDREPMSVYEHSLMDMWNSQFMRDIRRDMVQGKTVPHCGYCAQQEQAGLQSQRISTNLIWQRELAHEQKGPVDHAFFEEQYRTVSAEAAANDYNVKGRPDGLELDVGNLCNLKCRMCNSYSSSYIAADPVHAPWAYSGPIPARWQGTAMSIAPDRFLGIAYEGITWPVVKHGRRVGWTDGNAGLRVSLGTSALAGLVIQVSGDKPAAQPLRVLVNGETVFDGPLPLGQWRGTFDMSNFKAGNELEIRIVSPVFVNPDLQRSVGVGIEEVKLLRARGGTSEVHTSQLANSGLWFQDDEFLKNGLLAEPEKLRRLRFMGGEPFLIKEVHSMMKHLVDVGAAPNIKLWMITNGTILDERYIELCQQFEHCDLMLSLDGVGAVNDYIRFPSRFDAIDRNIGSFAQMRDTDVWVNMTVQAYNVLDVVDVIKYCFSRGIGFQYHLLQYPPYLSTAVLPQRIREIASERLHSFLEENIMYPRGSLMRPDLPASIVELAAAIRAQTIDDKLLQEFMLFTNDMDSSREQRFAKALPELNELLGLADVVWSKNYRFTQRSPEAVVTPGRTPALVNRPGPNA